MTEGRMEMSRVMATEIKVYLAGPEVFLPDAAPVVEEMRRLCREHGLTPIAPLDAGVDGDMAGASGPADAAPDPGWIFEKNVSRIRASDAVIANVNHFRGSEPDSGTCFELGYAHALGKKLYIYSDDGATAVERVREFYGPVSEVAGERPTDPDGTFVENFDYAVNLMMAVPSVNVNGTFAAAVKVASADLLG